MKTQGIPFALAIVLLCPIASAQWVHTNLPDSSAVNCLAVSGTNLFAATMRGGVFLSSNSGANWIPIDSGLTDGPILSFAVSGSNLFAGTNGGGVFLSTDNGTSWSLADAGLPESWGAREPVRCFAVNGTALFAGTGGGVFLSTNNGTSWAFASMTSATYCLAVSGTNLFAAPYSGGVWLSPDNGASWSRASVGLPYGGGWYAPVSCFAVSGTNLFAGIVGVYLNPNSGTSWTSMGPMYFKVSCLAVSGTNLFAGTNAGSGVYFFANGGAGWIGFNAGLTSSSVGALAVSGTNLFAGTPNGIWRRPLSEVSVKPISSELPADFNLEQNFPNPFNPSTTIKYELPIASLVSLTVFDVLGREVCVLVNDRGDAGVHEVKFDGSNLASGVYFYRLQAGDFVATKRLLLVK